jgi:hypothetical protein
MSVDRHIPFRYLLPARRMIVRTEANRRFARGLLFGAADVSSLKMVGVRVKAIRRRTVATTLGVKSR